MYISKIKLHNYRRFRDIEIRFNEGKNILVGNNESGKSSIIRNRYANMPKNDKVA